jgi:hypothetical protein
MFWLKVLTLNLNANHPNCLMPLSALTRLETLDLDMRHTEASLCWLSVLTTLQTLRLTWRQSTGRKPLAPFLPHLCGLSRLSALTLEGRGSCDLVADDAVTDEVEAAAIL